MRRSHVALLLVLLFLTGSPCFGSGTHENVENGNEAVAAGNFEAALGYYEKALVSTPESPEILFNKAVVQYTQGDYLSAADGFGQAALKTRDLSLEAKATYNRGNCIFMQAQKQQDADLEKALESYEASIAAYKRALEFDPTLAQAAHNIEVARLIMKALLDELQKQKQAAQEQQQAMQEIVEALLEVMNREQAHIEETSEISGSDSVDTAGRSSELDRLAGEQETTGQKTREVSDRLLSLVQQDTESPVTEAKDHVDRSALEQTIAAELLRATNPTEALTSELTALEELERALEALTEPEQNQEPRSDDQTEEQQQAASEQSSPQGDQLDEEARTILAEEQENRQMREEADGRYQDVDRDW